MEYKFKSKTEIKKCLNCPFNDYEQGYCIYSETSGKGEPREVTYTEKHKEKPKWCPLMEVWK